MSKIFVQIASYRDPELLPTIKDLLANAKNPENLTFGVCNQYGEGDPDSLLEYRRDPRFRIIDIPWKESKGLCWARHLIQKLYEDETYTLQLDSHHRFVKDWDVELIEMLKSTGAKKPIITSYAGIYKPKDDGTYEILNDTPFKMVASKFTESGTILFFPNDIPHYKMLKKPIKARFVSGHFFFTLGIHCKEYKYDPNLYFAGDEISLSIRSFTLGYDLFHPHKTVIFHEYTREGRTKHWSDFSTENKVSGVVDNAWYEMDTASKIRLRHMLQEEDNGIDLGIYGLGNVRSHHSYEIYAGIDFKTRRLHPNTLLGIDPPINDDTPWWLEQPEANVQVTQQENMENIEEKPEENKQEILENQKEYNYDLTLIEPKDYKFVYIGVEDEAGNLLYREDLKFVPNILKLNFKSDKVPFKWIYWIVKENGEWGTRIDTKF